jgi:hypothetical protein
VPIALLHRYRSPVREVPAFEHPAHQQGSEQGQGRRSENQEQNNTYSYNPISVVARLASIRPALCPIDSDGVVIHLCSGDFSGHDNFYCITNPMCFYRQIARQCRYAIVVIKPGGVYPLLQSIVSLFCEVTVVSGTAHDDFRLLCNATHLVSSGAGAFVMAAALFSRDSRIFHCTAFSN